MAKVVGLKEKPRLKKIQEEKIIPEMMKEFGLKNRMEVPKIKKVVLNMGVGEASKEQKSFENAQRELEMITGQKAIVNKARKAIAGFKIREGQPVGLKVTLRGDRMYEFIDRLISLAIPRMRDFRGLSRKSFDQFGNYSLGIQEQLIFPEVDYDKVDKVRGLDVTIVVDAKNKEQAEALLEKIGFPFKEKK